MRRGHQCRPVEVKGRVLVPWESEVSVDGRSVRLLPPDAPTVDAAVALLRAWRTQVAARDRVPAYVVFSDAHLEGIAAAMPSRIDDLARCRGVGPAKLEKYGDEILAVLDSRPA